MHLDLPRMAVEKVHQQRRLPDERDRKREGHKLDRAPQREESRGRGGKQRRKRKRRAERTAHRKRNEAEARHMHDRQRDQYARHLALKQLKTAHEREASTEGGMQAARNCGSRMNQAPAA